MNINDFDFNLPPELIAQYPLPERSASRLLVMSSQTDNLQHLHFNQLPELLGPHDLLVFNNTKVMPARLLGHKETGGKVEVLIERILENKKALVQIKASKALRVGGKIIFTDLIEAEVVERQDDLFVLYFHAQQQTVLAILDKIGHVPLPPYITRSDEILDQQRYQTVFAEKIGSIAAPTASLHFDANLLQGLQEKNINTTYVTLHVGAGTFQPIRVENILEHKMHAEYLEINTATCEAIQQCKAKGGRVIAVGTTVVRSLETAAKQGNLQTYQGDTRIFIYPGFQFQVVDAMITNFHLPKSTLLMLVAAFAGREKILHAYNAAINEQYRFFSYGDAMLLGDFFH